MTNSNQLGIKLTSGNFFAFSAIRALRIGLGKPSRIRSGFHGFETIPYPHNPLPEGHPRYAPRSDLWCSPPFPLQGPSGEFPCFTGTIKVLRLLACLFSSLISFWSEIPILRSSICSARKRLLGHRTMMSQGRGNLFSPPPSGAAIFGIGASEISQAMHWACRSVPG